MLRVVFLCLACTSVVSAAQAQQPAAPAGPAANGSVTEKWIGSLQAMQARLEYEGDHVRFVGNVDLPVPGQSGYRLYADSMDVDRANQTFVAEGNIAFTTPDGFVFADRLEYNIAEGTAKFYVASGLMTLPDANRAEFGNQDPDVIFWGELVEKQGPRKYVVTRGAFTTCVQPTPRWEIEGDKITIRLDDYAVARSTVLRVKGVPLLYLPAVYYPLHEEQRSTGFLMPSYGRSNLRGGAISNAFFWAIGRSQDATFYHDWFTKAGTGQGAEYRYVASAGSSGLLRFYRFNQDATVFEQDGIVRPLPDQTTYQVNAAVNQDLGYGLKGQANVEYFTDVATQQLYQQNAYQRSPSQRRIAGGVTGVYGRTTVGGYYSRSEQFYDEHNSAVYGSTPRLTANLAPSRIFGSPVYGSVNSEYIFQPNRRLEDGVVKADESVARFDVTPTVRMPLSRLTYLSLTTNAAYHHTYFSNSVDETGVAVGAPVTRRYLSLQTDIVGPVLSKIWDTPGSSFSDRMKHVIEPTFNLEYITDIANQTRVPRSDSSVFAVGGAMRFTYGVTNRLFARTPANGATRGSTREFMTIGVQQTYYTNPETSRFDTTYVSYSGRPKPVDLSPVAVTARVSPTGLLDANARLEYDVTGNGLQILTAGSTVNTGAGSANLTFSRQRFTPSSDVSSYLSGSSSWRFAQGRMTAFYGLNWDIDAGYIYSQSLGGAYLAQCCGIQADYQVVNFTSTSASPIPSDRRLNFAFVLAGLGTFSNFFGLFGGQP
jgi:LPS-assembly protein